MTQKTNKVVFPQLAEWVIERANKSERPFVRDSAIGIKHGLSLLESLPDKYEWQFCSDDSFKAKLDELVNSSNKSIFDCNKITWNDYSANWEAYAFMSYWRGVELIQPAIRCINLREYVAAAVLSRSLLELSATFLMNANTIEASVKQLPDLHNKLVVSDLLEKFTNKAIWGSRLVEKDDPLYQSNVLTVLQKISKNPNATELFSIYEYLCEVAHPNVMGNARFWSHVESVDTNGCEMRIISRFADTDKAQIVLENTLWALAWGSAVINNAFQITSSAVHNLSLKLRGVS